MFTIFNLLNYLVGKPLNTFVLILVTVLIYFLLIKYYYDVIHENTVYTIILLVLMIIDITSIIVVYFYLNDDSKELNIEKENDKILNIANSCNIKDKLGIGKNSEKKSSKRSSKRSSKKSSKSDDKLDKNQQNIDNQKPTYSIGDENPDDKDIISLYDINKDVSLKTY